MKPQVFMALAVFALIAAFPGQGAANDAERRFKEQLTILRGDVEAVFDRFSPAPFRPIRKSELDALLAAAGYEWSEGVQDYSKRGPRPEDGGRQEEFVVVPTFCAMAGDPDPWVGAYVFQVSPMRGDAPWEFLEQIRTTVELSRHARFSELESATHVSFFVPFPVPDDIDTPWILRVEGEATVSETYNQKMTLAMYVSCPDNG